MTGDDEMPVADKPFHGWRLLGVVAVVFVFLALVSLAISWFVTPTL
jgi:hypothetical protein